MTQLLRSASLGALSVSVSPGAIKLAVSSMGTVCVALFIGVASAALIFALELVIEGIFVGARMPLNVFAFAFILNFLIGLPFAVLGGVPSWMILRSKKVQSPAVFALIGGLLGLTEYLLLVAIGMAAPSDRPMTFLQNIGRWLHVPRIAAVIVAGAAGGMMFEIVMRFAAGRRLTDRGWKREDLYARGRRED